MVNSPKNMKAALLKLAYLLNIRVKTGRLKELAKKLNVTVSTVYGWVRNGQISKPGWKKINKLNIPLEEWYIPKCGRKNRAEDLTCMECGGPI